MFKLATGACVEIKSGMDVPNEVCIVVVLGLGVYNGKVRFETFKGKKAKVQ